MVAVFIPKEIKGILSNSLNIALNWSLIEPPTFDYVYVGNYNV